MAACFNDVDDLDVTLIVQTDAALTVLAIEPEREVTVLGAVMGAPGVGIPGGGNAGQIIRKGYGNLTQWVEPLRLVTTLPLPIQGGRIALPSKPFGDVMWGLALVYADLTPDDFSTNGELLFDRPYLIEEHNGIMVVGATAIFTGVSDELDGKHAVVSYTAW